MKHGFIKSPTSCMYLCNEYGLHDGNPVSLPMDPNHPFGRTDEVYPDVPDIQHAYRKLIGELIYLSTCSRPDIALAVQRLSQQCACPEPRHFSAARRVVRYLKGIQSLCIHFGNPRVDLAPHAFSDSDWATSAEDHVSITGYVWYFYGAQSLMRPRNRQHMLSPQQRQSTWLLQHAPKKGSA